MSRIALACVFVACLACTAAAAPAGTDEQHRLGRADREVTAAFALESPAEAFAAWQRLHGRSYKSAREAARRRDVFAANAAYVACENSRNAGSLVLELNQFADLTWDEFRASRLGFNPAARLNERRPADAAEEAAPFMYAKVDPASLPPTIDWRDKGAVTPAKNQGMCGSCWAFSAVGAVEGINAIRTGELVSLSEQQLVDCDSEKDLGCGGGLMDYAFKYIEENGGIDTEDDYSYWGYGLICQRRKEADRHVVTIDGHEDVPANSLPALQAAVAHQPVSVAICATMTMQFYRSGVINEDSCCQDLNHGVLAVGYDLSGPDPHLLIKNSWGDSWGEEGFFKLAAKSKDPRGTCGVLTTASYPTKEGTTNPEVPSFCGWFGWTECPAKSTCECQFSLLGLFCMSWGCAAN